LINYGRYRDLYFWCKCWIQGVQWEIFHIIQIEDSNLFRSIVNCVKCILFDKPWWPVDEVEFLEFLTLLSCAFVVIQIINTATLSANIDLFYFILFVQCHVACMDSRNTDWIIMHIETFDKCYSPGLLIILLFYTKSVYFEV
jgi:hypothetical protein